MAKKKTKTAGKRAARSRRGKSEAMTGAKANQVEVRAVGIGDNSELLLVEPDDFDHHLKSIRGARDKAATSNSLVRHAKAAANKCRPGLAAVIEETLSIERENDPAKLKSHFDMLGLGLKRINSTVQLSVFDTLAGDQMDLIYRRFYADGKAGKTLDNRYPEGTELALQADRAYRHGMAANLSPPISPEEADKALEDDELLEKLAKLPPAPAMSEQQTTH